MMAFGFFRLVTSGSMGPGIKMAILGYLIIMISFWLYNPGDFSIFSGPVPLSGPEPSGKGFH